MENTQYMEVVTARRAELLPPEEALIGLTPISIETCLANDGNLGDWVLAHPALFLDMVDDVSDYDRALLLSYYFLGKSQDTMSAVFLRPQSYVANHIRVALINLLHGGVARRREVKESVSYVDVFRVDPMELGQFRVDVTSAGFGTVFSSVGRRGQ